MRLTCLGAFRGLLANLGLSGVGRGPIDPSLALGSLEVAIRGLRAAPVPSDGQSIRPWGALLPTACNGLGASEVAGWIEGRPGRVSVPALATLVWVETLLQVDVPHRLVYGPVQACDMTLATVRRSGDLPDAPAVLVRVGWDGRILRMGPGVLKPTPADPQARLAASLVVYTLDPDSVRELRRTFSILAVPAQVVDRQLHEAGVALGATWCVRPLPGPGPAAAAVFMPLDDVRTRRLWETLAMAGAPDLIAEMERGLEIQATLVPVEEWVPESARPPLRPW